MRMNKLILFIFVLACWAVLSDCTAQPQSVVEIRDFSFQPGSLTVVAGTTVNWINNDGAYHTITADNGEFDSGPLVSGGQVALTFSRPGSYPYHCSIHPSMQGQITVMGRESFGKASGVTIGSSQKPAAARAGSPQYEEPNIAAAPPAQSSYPPAMDQMPSPAARLDLVVIPYYTPPECHIKPKKPATVLIMSKKVKGYDVFVDGVYETTEGLTGPVDGSLTIHVSGDQFHTVTICKGDYVNSDCRLFAKGGYYYITL